MATTARTAAPGEATPRPPLAPQVRSLLARADREITAAHESVESAPERFVHAHLGALRAAAAVVGARARPRARRAPRPVWDLLVEVAPELAAWSVYFAAGARLRASLEAGSVPDVPARRADEILAAAEDFVDEVRILLEGDAPGFVTDPRRAAAARAS